MRHGPVCSLSWRSAGPVFTRFAVAAASLAGERENGTLWLLDALPAGRGSVWGAKISFALGSTLALGLLLFALSVVSTETWGLLRPRNATVVAGALVLLQVLGWGFFWSAVCGHALTAAVLAVCSMGLTMPLFEIGLNSGSTRLPMADAASAGRRHGGGLGVLFYPVRPAQTAARQGTKRREGARGRIVRRGAAKLAQGFASLAPRCLEPGLADGSRDRLALVAAGAHRPRRAGDPERSGSTMPERLGDPTFCGVFNVAAGILAGVSIFGTEYGSRTRRFLANQRSGPG